MSDEGEPPFERDFCIYSKSSKPARIPIISKHVDPMTYPLIFPSGQEGWQPNYESKNENKFQVTALQYYSYLFSVKKEFNPCLNLGKLTQQFILDSWCKVEGTRLFYIRNEQAKLRTEMYSGLMDYVSNKALLSNANIGKMVILPSTFIGSPLHYSRIIFIQ